ncbi:unnamed protein product [Moneuplotes crassus]|uniref:Uncharacterized protein n=1 Tax=Euplotes crassus TaxID=5936 RepID=A0AAD1XG97_EUPCR|nr:unnamed protein product [Moneuplotes crassus]
MRQSHYFLFFFYLPFGLRILNLVKFVFLFLGTSSGFLSTLRVAFSPILNGDGLILVFETFFRDKLTVLVYFTFPRVSRFLKFLTSNFLNCG